MIVSEGRGPGNKILYIHPLLLLTGFQKGKMFLSGSKHLLSVCISGPFVVS